MSRAEALIWMTAISLITFVSTVFLTGIIVDGLVAPTTTLSYIKEITGIFTSILSIPLTMFGLYLAYQGLSTWKKQLKTDKTITALENAMNEVDNITSTCWQAENFQEILFENINFTQSDNTFNDIEINKCNDACLRLSQLANKLRNICNKPLVDPLLKDICQSLINDSGEVWMQNTVVLAMNIADHQKIRRECFKPKNDSQYASQERVGFDEIQTIEQTKNVIKSKLIKLKTTSLQTRSALNRVHLK
jgi:hypothetical protein